MPPAVFKKIVATGESRSASEFLAALSGLSRTKVKEAMIKGAVWRKKGNGKRRRLRRAATTLAPGDLLEFFYDEDILAKKPPPADILCDRKLYTVWVKPAGMMTQGSNFGDHCSLLRAVERHYLRRRPVYPVHRLDREVPGVVVVAHSRAAARYLSALFGHRQVIKTYRAEVLGALDEYTAGGRIDFPLDGKPAITEFSVTAYSPADDTTALTVRPVTGRRHQLRRHFDMIGHPIIGDPLYGAGNKNPAGLKLTAVSLEFRYPGTKKNSVFAMRE